MNTYFIMFIDGRDLRFKRVWIEAKSEAEAKKLLLKKYEPYGDFEHHFIEIKEIKA